MQWWLELFLSFTLFHPILLFNNKTYFMYASPSYLLSIIRINKSNRKRSSLHDGLKKTTNLFDNLGLFSNLLTDQFEGPILLLLEGYLIYQLAVSIHVLNANIIVTKVVQIATLASQEGLHALDLIDEMIGLVIFQFFEHHHEPNSHQIIIEPFNVLLVLDCHKWGSFAGIFAV